MSQELATISHQAIKKVTHDLEGMNFNTAISALMEYTNALYKIANRDGEEVYRRAPAAWLQALRILLQLTAPFAPHLSEELWQQFVDTDQDNAASASRHSIHLAPWPSYDEQYLIQDTVTIVIQVNGKLRGELQMARDADEAEVVEAAQNQEKDAAYLSGHPIRKTIFIPGRLVNFVI
jgi:leucyl-tRNA synthetase